MTRRTFRVYKNGFPSRREQRDREHTLVFVGVIKPLLYRCGRDNGFISHLSISVVNPTTGRSLKYASQRIIIVLHTYGIFRTFYDLLLTSAVYCTRQIVSFFVAVAAKNQRNVFRYLRLPRKRKTKNLAISFFYDVARYGIPVECNFT